jgi:hypothetical protein
MKMIDDPIQDLCHALTEIWLDAYNQAGAPYGWRADGIRRWCDERRGAVDAELEEMARERAALRAAEESS